MRTVTTTMRKLITLLPLFLLLFGCGSGSSNYTADSGGTGSIAANLEWSASKTAAKTVSLAPAGVTTVRIIVSGGDMTAKQQDFSATAGTGTLSGIPAGTGRTVTAQGINGSGNITHSGVKSNVTVNAGQITNVGTIVMLPIALPGGTGEVKVTLQWAGCADLDLYVIDPCNNELSYMNPDATCQTKAGSLDLDANVVTCAASPAENIFWTTAPVGNYSVSVNLFANSTAQTTIPYTVTTIVDGVINRYNGSISTVGASNVITSFTKSVQVGGLQSLPGHKKSLFEMALLRGSPMKPANIMCAQLTDAVR